MSNHLPDCMMPDGADPCKGYQELHAEIERLQKAVDWGASGIAERDAEIEGLRALNGRLLTAVEDLFEDILAHYLSAVRARAALRQKELTDE